MKILISGGGIAGLCAYIALREDLHEVSLIEKRDNFSPRGAGIIFGMNVMLMLEKIGLADAVQKEAKELIAFRVSDRDEKTLSLASLESLKEKYKTQAIGIKRATLHKILEEKIDSSTVSFNRTIKTIKEVYGQKKVVFNDGFTEHYDLVIIAEGIHSETRELLLGDNPYRYSGYTCWRTIIDNNSGDELLEMWGDQKRLGIVPVNETQSYLFLVKNALPSDEKMSQMSISELKEEFSEFKGRAKEILDQIPESTSLIHNDLYDYSTIDFEKDRVVFIGDSAHAMTPNMGQGAAMGIEDAVILAQCIKSNPKNFKDVFIKKRFDRVKKIHKTSWIIGKMAHVKSPFLQRIRDILSKLTSSSMVKQIDNGVIKPILSEV